MKKLVIICTLLFALFTGLSQQVDAQDLSFQQPDKVAGLSIGLGGTLYSGYDSGFSRTPAISLTFEQCVKDNLFDENSSLGIGGVVGFASAKYNAPGDAWSWKSTNFILGGRGALHYEFLENLDTYTGLMLGYNIVSTKYTGDVSQGASGGGFAWAWYLGGRYYFSESLAAFAELGYGIAVLNLGVALKF